MPAGVCPTTCLWSATAFVSTPPHIVPFGLRALLGSFPQPKLTLGIVIPACMVEQSVEPWPRLPIYLARQLRAFLPLMPPSCRPSGGWPGLPALGCSEKSLGGTLTGPALDSVLGAKTRLVTALGSALALGAGGGIPLALAGGGGGGGGWFINASVSQPPTSVGAGEDGGGSVSTSWSVGDRLPGPGPLTVVSVDTSPALTPVNVGL